MTLSSEKITFQHEPISDQLIKEAEPLLRQHYEEIAHDKAIALDPDWDVYKNIDALGMFRAFTARDAETEALVGYAWYFIKNSPHYKSSLQAVQDIIFIKKESRGFGKKFISWCDEELRAIGCQCVYHHVKAKHNFGPLLETLGYGLVDLIYVRKF